VDALTQAHQMEALMLRQKCQEKRDVPGNKNTAYYHNFLKYRNKCRSVFSVSDSRGTKCEGQWQVEEAFVKHFFELLKSHEVPQSESTPFDDLAITSLNSNQANSLIQSVSDEEIQDALFSIPKNSTGGPDGFTSWFFISCWEVVKHDFIKATRSFFVSNKLLLGINSTFICLVPKIDVPSSVKHFRLISCCKIVYKYISKILAHRMKQVMHNLISVNQSAFLEGRNITDNILLSHELLRGYEGNYLSPRCCLKVDIMKAYDTICRESILYAL